MVGGSDAFDGAWSHGVWRVGCVGVGCGGAECGADCGVGLSFVGVSITTHTFIYSTIIVMYILL